MKETEQQQIPSIKVRMLFLFSFFSFCVRLSLFCLFVFSAVTCNHILDQKAEDQSTQMNNEQEKQQEDQEEEEKPLFFFDEPPPIFLPSRHSKPLSLKSENNETQIDISDEDD
jgi:hypothetical protein